MEVRPKMPVSERAVLARVNRKLASDGRKLRKVKTAAKLSRASYYLIDERRRFMADSGVNLEQFAKKLGVLEAWERLLIDGEANSGIVGKRRLAN